MKRLFLLLALCGMVAVGCTEGGIDDNINNGGGNNTEQPGGETDDDLDDEVNEIPSNEIWYTSTNNLELLPASTKMHIFGANLTSNIYKDGKGVLTFDGIVDKIGDGAFQGCTTLASITIPDSVTTIGDNAFHSCVSLASVTIPEGVTEIGSQAFAVCTSLTSVTIPASVTSVSYLAFAHCFSLKEVYCKPTTPPTGDSSMFHDNASGRKIYVPTESVDAYKSAECWSDYADYFEGYDF